MAAGQGFKGVTALMGQPLKLKIRYASPEGTKSDPDLEAFLSSRGLLSFSILIEPLASVGAVRDFLEKKLTMAPQPLPGARSDASSLASVSSSVPSQAQAGEKESKRDKKGSKGKAGEDGAGSSDGGTGFVYNRFEAMGGDDGDGEEDDVSSGRNHFSQDREDAESSRSLSSHSVCHDYEDDEMSSMGDDHEVMRAAGSVDSEADDSSDISGKQYDTG